MNPEDSSTRTPTKKTKEKTPGPEPKKEKKRPRQGPTRKTPPTKRDARSKKDTMGTHTPRPGRFKTHREKTGGVVTAGIDRPSLDGVLRRKKNTLGLHQGRLRRASKFVVVYTSHGRSETRCYRREGEKNGAI